MWTPEQNIVDQTQGKVFLWKYWLNFAIWRKFQAKNTWRNDLKPYPKGQASLTMENPECSFDQGLFLATHTSLHKFLSITIYFLPEILFCVDNAYSWNDVVVIKTNFLFLYRAIPQFSWILGFPENWIIGPHSTPAEQVDFRHGCLLGLVGYILACVISYQLDQAERWKPCFLLSFSLYLHCSQISPIDANLCSGRLT